VRSLLTHQDKPELHHLLADVDEKLGDSLEAVHEYQRAAELDPREPYLFDWGSELLLHHAPEPAEAVFTHGARLFPQSVRMLLGVGAASFASGANDQAVQQICAASDLNPNDPDPYLFLGKMLSAEKIPSEKVLDRLHQFATLQPRNAKAHYYYAVALWKRRDPQDPARASQVESELAVAIHLDPQFAAAELQLGIVHADEGDSPGAIPHYERALQIAPQTEEAHYRLAQAYRQTGQSEKAKAELRAYGLLSKESAQKLEEDRHEIRQFVYTLRDQPSAPTPKP
jgi:tetratricopeptide (TPR) repeat protein